MPAEMGAGSALGQACGTSGDLRKSNGYDERGLELLLPGITTLRILIYGLNFTPELTGIGKYTGEMAAWLARRGHEVRVIAAPPYYPAWRIREDYRGKLFRTERPAAGLTVYRTPLYVPAKPSGVKRMLHLFSFMLGSIPAMLRQILWRPEVVWTVEPTFFGAPLALMVARATGAGAWLHVQDYEIDAAFDLGLLPAEGPVHALALRLEHVFTRSFDRVSSISPMMVLRAEQKGVPAQQATLFPNWVDVATIQPEGKETANAFREELSLGGKIVLLYSGNMGNKQGLESLAPLAAALEGDPRVHFVFCGDGAFRPQLVALVQGRQNVTLLPLQPLERLGSLLNAADIHLLPQRAGAADLVMPSKLTGMLASGRPVLATAEAGTMLADVLAGETEQGALGLSVRAGDDEALCAAAKRLIDSAELRERLGANARAYAVQRLGRDEVLSRFEQELLLFRH